jgi:Mor family transcriptional regulator
MGVNLRRKESGQVLLDVILQVTSLLVERGISKETAVIVSQEVAQFLGRHWSGSAVYFSGRTLAFKLVEAELETDFDGSRDSIIALARKHGIPEATVYEILSRHRKRIKRAGEA